MQMNRTFRTHAIFARGLIVRAQEMRAGRHDETHAMAMHLAANTIMQLAHRLALTERRLAAAEAPRRPPAPFLRPAAAVAALALVAASVAAIVVQFP